MQLDAATEGQMMCDLRDFILCASRNDRALAIAHLFAIAEDIASSSDSMRTTGAVAAARLVMRLDADVLQCRIVWH